jgi:rubrerythrin
MNTKDNLKEAFSGESQANQKYRPMVEQAEAEAHRAKLMFGYAVKAEAVHADLYRRALEAVEQNKDITEARFYLCPVCGYIEFGVPPERCPICGALGAKFVEVA